MHSGDLIVNENLRIVAVLDFADARAGDPRWDLM